MARPEFDPTQYPPEAVEDARAEFVRAMEELEARGVLRLDFGPDPCGVLTTRDHESGEFVHLLCQERVEIPAYTSLISWQAILPPADVLEGFPVQHLSYLLLFGADDARVAALARHTELQLAEVSAVVSSAWVEDCYSRVACPPASLATDAVLGEPLTDASLDSLGACHDLVSMRLTSTLLSDDAIARAADGLPRLTSLDLHSDEATFAGVGAYHRHPLQRLALHGEQLVGGIFTDWETFPDVRELSLTGAGVGEHLDGPTLARVFPRVSEVILLDADEEEVDFEHTVSLRQALPQAQINGSRLSPKALARRAARLGLGPTEATP